LRRYIKPAKAYFSSDRQLYRSLRNILGFYPKNIDLYKLAFRHKSVAQELKQGVKDSNERLEYLGDAVLSTVIAHYLFQTFPYKDEGFLTKMRSRLVSRTQLNKLAVKLGINQLVEANVDTNTRNKSINGDAFEALIGAIYLDRGYKIAQNFVLNRIIKNHIDIDEVESTETDFKSKLIEWVQKEKKELRFEVLEEIGSGHDKQYLVEIIIDEKAQGRGQHFSKKRAEQMASEETLKMLDLLE
jgi:ribonuclease III